MASMSIEIAFLLSCLIIGVGSTGLTLFALNIRCKNETGQEGKADRC
jgi:type IV secretory pathway TrbL component